MNLDFNALAQCALAHLKHLSGDIGPRPAGSPAETRAQEYIASHLAGWGYAVAYQPFQFTALPRYPSFGLLYGLLLIAGGWLAIPFPWASLALPLLIPTLPQAYRWLQRVRRPTEPARNLAAWAPTPADAPRSLLFCAHTDSARALPFRGRWLKLHGYTLDIAQRAALACAALAVARLLGFAVPELFAALVAGLASLAGLWLAVDDICVHLHHRQRYSPGANDNASGVAALLAVAEQFAASFPQQIRLGFLFTSAEETGMHGATAFAAQLARQETPARPPAPRRGREERPAYPDPPLTGVLTINLDMVGAGDTLRLVSTDGVYLPLATDIRLNDLLRQAYPDIQEISYTIKSGDFSAFLQRGFPAASLQTSGSPNAERNYHTEEDTAEHVESAALEMTLQAVVRLIQRMEQG